MVTNRHQARNGNRTVNERRERNDWLRVISGGSNESDDLSMRPLNIEIFVGGVVMVRVLSLLLWWTQIIVHRIAM